jgi:hypothetical protein
VLTSISPSSVGAGVGDTTITLTGNFFDKTALVYVNGVALAAPNITSATSMTAVVLAASLASTGTLFIRVANGTGTSASVLLTVAPAIAITSISPTSVVAGAGDTTITITGTGFTNPSVAKAASTSLTQVNFIGATSFTAKILAAQLVSSGTLAITVVGGTGSVTFTVQAVAVSFDDSNLLPTQFAAQFALDTTKTVYNVKNAPYNAVGNGIADDTLAIRAAITAAAAGGIVYLPTGTYAVCCQDGDYTQLGPYSITISGSTITGSSAATAFAARGNGMSIYFVNGGTLPQISGVNVNAAKGNANWYFVGNISGSTFSLYTTRANAMANTSPITFSSAGSGVQITCPPYNEILQITHSNIVLIGDGPANTVIKAYVTGLLDPTTNWVTTGRQDYKIGRGSLFWLNSTASGSAVSGVQFRSFKMDGQCPYTGDNSTGGTPTTGDGWDIFHKGALINGVHMADNTLFHNIDGYRWRGEILYAGGDNTTLGTVAIINCKLHGTNADAVSMSVAMTCANCAIGGSTAGDDCFNGFENRSYPGQNSLIQDCTIQVGASTQHGFGIAILGASGATWTAQRNTITNAASGILLSEACHTLLVDSNTFSNCGNCILISRLGLYGDLPAGWTDFTISNNTYGGTVVSGGLYLHQGPTPTHNLAFSANTIQTVDTNHRAGIIGGNFGEPLSGWGTFTIDGTVVGTGSGDGTTYPVRAVWTNTSRGGQKTGHRWDFGSEPAGALYVVEAYSDQVYLNTNASAGHAFAVFDPATFADYPTNFQTTFVLGAQTNWYLPANAAWNTWVSDIHIVDGVTTIKFNGTKFDQTA